MRTRSRRCCLRQHRLQNGRVPKRCRQEKHGASRRNNRKANKGRTNRERECRLDNNAATRLRDRSSNYHNFKQHQILQSLPDKRHPQDGQTRAALGSDMRRREAGRQICSWRMTGMGKVARPKVPKVRGTPGSNEERNGKDRTVKGEDEKTE